MSHNPLSPKERYRYHIKIINVPQFREMSNNALPADSGNAFIVAPCVSRGAIS